MSRACVRSAPIPSRTCSSGRSSRSPSRCRQSRQQPCHVHAHGHACHASQPLSRLAAAAGRGGRRERRWPGLKNACLMSFA
ncbi:unnamed protein product [Sphagnum tenellum]